MFIPEQVTGNTSQEVESENVKVEDGGIPEASVTQVCLFHQGQQHQFTCKRGAESFYLNHSPEGEATVLNFCLNF